MVPGMTPGIMRWRRELSILIALVPVALPFQISAMAISAMLLINSLAQYEY